MQEGMDTLLSFEELLLLKRPQLKTEQSEDKLDSKRETVKFKKKQTTMNERLILPSKRHTRSQYKIIIIDYD